MTERPPAPFCRCGSTTLQIHNGPTCGPVEPEEES